MFGFFLGGLFIALILDRCNKKNGHVIVPKDTSSYSAVFPPEIVEEISIKPATPKEVIKVVYRDRWRDESSAGGAAEPDTTFNKNEICDSLMQFRTYELKAGSEKVDITAQIKVLGYLDSSRIDWKMNIPEVRMPSLKKVFIGGFVENQDRFGGMAAYVNKRVMYFGTYDNKKEVSLGVAWGL